jgi:hypothetical protein
MTRDIGDHPIRFGPCLPMPETWSDGFKITIAELVKGV